MKAILTLISLLFCGAAHAAPAPLDRQISGSVGYYVDTQEKSLYLEMPLSAEFTFTEVDSDTNLVNLEIRLQTSLNRGDINALVSRYPGYALASFDSFARVRSATVHLPGGQPMDLTIAHSYEPIIDGMMILKKKDFDNLVQRFRRGEQPEIQIVLNRTVPGRTEIEKIVVPTGEICEAVRQTSPLELAASTAVGRIVGKLQSLITVAKTTSTVELMVEQVLAQCLELRQTPRADEVSSLADVPVRLNKLERSSSFSIVKSRSENIKRDSAAAIEVRTGGEK